MVVQQKPALILGAVLVLIIPALAVVDPARLLDIVFIVIPVSADEPPAVGRKLVREVFETEVDVHAPGNAVYLPLVGGLPHGRVLVGRLGIETGDPDVVVDLGHIDFVGKPIVVGIDHRIITGIFNFPAECVDHVGQSGGR